MVLDGQRMGDERDWVLVGFFVTCSSSAEKRFIRPAKQDEMGLCRAASASASASSQHALLGPPPRSASSQAISPRENINQSSFGNSFLSFRSFVQWAVVLELA